MLRRPGWGGWVIQQDVVVTDHLEPRVRVPADLLRCLLSVAEIAALAGIALLAGATATGLDIDIVGASHRLPAGLLRLIGYAGSLVLLTLPVALAVRLLLLRQFRRLTEALITGGITAGGVAVIDLLLSSPSRLHAALHTPAPGPTFDGYLAAVVAYVTVIGLRGHAHWRPAFLTGIAFYGLTSLASGHATVVSVLIAVLIGSATGSGLRYAFGAISGRPTAAEIAAALSTDGAPITTIRRLGNGASETRRYEARTAAGRRLDVTVFDRDQQAADAFYRLYRRLRVSAHISRSAPLSLEGAVERQALMIWATRDAGVLTPKLRAVTRVGPDAAALATDHVEGTTLADSGAATTDDELRRVWDAVLRLHEHRVTHRALTADRILITRRGEVVLLDPGNGDVAASDLQTRLDLVQLIAQTALLVGADRAADVAIEKAGRVELLVPLLQPVALFRSTRAALRGRKDILGAVRKRLLAAAPDVQVPPVQLTRIRPRTLITLIAAVFAAYLLAGQVADVSFSKLLAHANPGWMLVALGLSAATYVGAAISLSGFVLERLSLLRTFLVQVAGSFVILVTPAAVEAGRRRRGRQRGRHPGDLVPDLCGAAADRDRDHRDLAHGVGARMGLHRAGGRGRPGADRARPAGRPPLAALAGGHGRQPGGAAPAGRGAAPGQARAGGRGSAAAHGRLHPVPGGLGQGARRDRPPAGQRGGGLPDRERGRLPGADPGRARRDRGRAVDRADRGWRAGGQGGDGGAAVPDGHVLAAGSSRVAGDALPAAPRPALTAGRAGTSSSVTLFPARCATQMRPAVAAIATGSANRYRGPARYRTSRPDGAICATASPSALVTHRSPPATVIAAGFAR